MHLDIVHAVIYYHDMTVDKIEKIICAYLGGWEQVLSTSRVAGALGISREHASRKIMTWARKAFSLSQPEGSVKTVFIDGGLEAMPPGLRSPREMMDNLPGLLLVCGDGLERPNIVRLGDLFCSEADPDIFHRIYAAMCRKEALLISYKAKSGDMSFWFSPHSLIDLPQRPHFRGHAQWIRDGDWAFIDMVPSRVALVEEISRERYVGEVADTSWNTVADLALKLSPELPQEIRATMIQEWGYNLKEIDGQLILRLENIREPLLDYVKDTMFWRAFRGKVYQIWTD